MSRYVGSDFYCLPDSLVLRNLANIDNQEELDAFEADITAVRIFEYTEAPLSGRFDLNHLCQIHHYVFQDVFDWAGQLRMVDISKGDSRFANFGLIDSYLGGVLEETLQAMIAAFRGNELLLRNLLTRITSRIRN